jgi:hypothetical protein
MAAPARARPCFFLSSPLHPLAFLPRLHGGKVDLSGHLLGYEILHGLVSLDDKLHAGGVASLVTSSSMVVGLLHRHVQPHLHSMVGYVVVCDGFCGVTTVDFRCCNMFFLMLQ